MSDICKRNRFDALAQLKTLGAESSSHDGQAVLLGPTPETAKVLVCVTEKSGTSPTLDLSIEGSNDAESWTAILSLSRISAPGQIEAALGSQNFRYYRYRSTIGGSDTPSFTYLLAFSC